MKKRVLNVTALSLVLFASAFAVEHEQRGGMEERCEMMRHQMMMHRMGKRAHDEHGRKGYAQMVLGQAEALKLSDEQLGKIARIQMQHQKSRREITKKLHKSMLAARRGIMDPASDETVIRNAVKDHAAAFDEMIEDALKQRQEVNAVLTPEQQKQLQSLKREQHDD